VVYSLIGGVFCWARFRSDTSIVDTNVILKDRPRRTYFCSTLYKSSVVEHASIFWSEQDKKNDLLYE
jgi:hypothetical protein